MLLSFRVSYNIRYNTIYDTKKLKIDLRYDSHFDNYALLWEGFSSQPPISRYCPLWLMPPRFVQSHISERRLPHVPYKLKPKTHVYHYYTCTCERRLSLMWD